MGRSLGPQLPDPFQGPDWGCHNPNDGIEDDESEDCIEVTERVPNSLAEHELGSIGLCGAHVSNRVSPSQAIFELSRSYRHIWAHCRCGVGGLGLQQVRTHIDGGGQAPTVCGPFCGPLPQFRRPVGAGDRLVREGTRSVVSVDTRWDSTGSGVTGWHGCRVLGDQGSAVQIRPARPTRNPCDGRGFVVSGLSLAGSVRVGRFVGHLSAVPVRSRPVLTRVL